MHKYDIDQLVTVIPEEEVPQYLKNVLTHEWYKKHTGICFFVLKHLENNDYVLEDCMYKHHFYWPESLLCPVLCHGKNVYRGDPCIRVTSKNVSVSLTYASEINFTITSEDFDKLFGE